MLLFFLGDQYFPSDSIVVGTAAGETSRELTARNGRVIFKVFCSQVGLLLSSSFFRVVSRRGRARVVTGLTVSDRDVSFFFALLKDELISCLSGVSTFENRFPLGYLSHYGFL